VLLLSLIVFLSLVFVRTFFRDSRPLGEQLYAAFIGTLQCFGVFLFLTVILTITEMVKQARARAAAARARATNQPSSDSQDVPETKDDGTKQ
jgi:hypothetical protein